jgi:hypothetical protein
VLCCPPGFQARRATLLEPLGGPAPRKAKLLGTLLHGHTTLADALLCCIELLRLLPSRRAALLFSFLLPLDFPLAIKRLLLALLFQPVFLLCLAAALIALALARLAALDRPQPTLVILYARTFACLAALRGLLFALLLARALAIVSLVALLLFAPPFLLTLATALLGAPLGASRAGHYRPL